MTSLFNDRAPDTLTPGKQALQGAFTRLRMHQRDVSCDHLVSRDIEFILDEFVKLRAGLTELLDVAERIRGGDASLDPEEWYAARDYARVTLAGGPSRG